MVTPNTRKVRKMNSFKKLYLQYSQVQALKRSSLNSARLNEQKKVLRKLFLKPYLLFSNKEVDPKKEHLAKYINHLNVIVNNDRLYKSAKNTLK